MSKIRIAVITAFLFALPLQAQVRRGSLVVWIVSKKADYVAIGAESRTVDGAGNLIDDRACKVISLGGDTLFFATGATDASANLGESWSSRETARAAYILSKNRDALSLINIWRMRALHWFQNLPKQELQNHATKPNESLASGGFVKFGNKEEQFFEYVEIFYNTSNRTVDAKTFSASPGEVRSAGEGYELLQEFFDRKTDRAIRAFGPASTALSIDPAVDARVIQKGIKFAMDNAVGQIKSVLGGDIDIAIIHKDRTIEWVARKPLCNQQDLKPTPLSKKR